MDRKQCLKADSSEAEPSGVSAYRLGPGPGSPSTSGLARFALSFSPTLFGDRTPRPPLGLSIYYSRTRHFGVARRRRARRPWTALVPVGLAENIEVVSWRQRGLCVSLRYFTIYPFRAVISFYFFIFIVVVRLSISSLRCLGLAVATASSRRPPWAGWPLALFHARPPLPRPDASTVLQRQEQQPIHSSIRQPKLGLIHDRRYLYLRRLIHSSLVAACLLYYGSSTVEYCYTV